MNTITPIFIPMNTETEKCPHCGKELPESDITWTDILLFILGMAVLVVILIGAVALIGKFVVGPMLDFIDSL